MSRSRQRWPAPDAPAQHHQSAPSPDTGQYRRRLQQIAFPSCVLLTERE
ncbi:EspF repeat-containing protein [Klebsiella quasipneumoniae]